jgi:DNA-binding SARP family transcriptional activator
MTSPQRSESPADSRTVEIVLLGGLGVRVDGVAVDLTSLRGRRARLAFAWLATHHGEVVSRDGLAEVIWGEPLPASWGSALRSVLATVRRTLQSPGLAGVISLSTAASGYRLDISGRVTVDVSWLTAEADQAERALRNGDAANALAIARMALEVGSGLLLEGDTSEWLDGLRRGLDDVRDRLQRAGAEAALAQGDTAYAEFVARRLIAADRFREDGYRLLIQALHAAGNRAAAVAAYDECCSVLSSELGITPSPSTEALMLRVLGAPDPVRDEPAAADRGVKPGAPLLIRQRQGSFVGRQALLSRLQDMVATIHDDGPRVVTIAGEPGMGKTRLAAELAARVQDAGIPVLYGRADDRLAVPFGSLLEAIGGALSTRDARALSKRLEPHTASLARLLPSLAEFSEAPAGSGPVDMGRAIEHAINVLAGERGALLVLDDMHWATRAELDVLQALADGAARSPILVVVLRRDSERTPVAGDAGAGAEPEPGTSELTLQPLTRDEIAELARAAGMHGTDAEIEQLSDRVLGLSGGNTLLASELLRSSTDAMAGRQATIDAVVADRLALLPAGAPAVLATAALAGLEFDPEVVAAAATVDTVSALQILEAASEIGLLVKATRDAQWVAFRHNLLRAALLETLEPGQRMRLHQRLGSVLEIESSSDPTTPASLAHHFGAAAPLGDWRRALDYGLRVAQAAYDAGVYEDAVAIATRTLELLAAQDDPDPPARLDLEVLLGGALRGLAEPNGFDVLHRAFEAALAIGLPRQAADAALAFSPLGAASDEGFLDDSLTSVYERAIEALGDMDPHRRARLLGHLATAHAWRRDAIVAMTLASEAVQLARVVGDRQTLGRVLTGARRMRAGWLDLDERAELETELLALADELDEPGMRISAALWRLETRIEQGQGTELEGWLDMAQANSDLVRLGTYRHTLAYMRAAVALVRGEIDEADRLVEHAARLGRELGLHEMIVEAIRRIQLIGVRHEQGRLDEIGEETAAFFTDAGMPQWLGAVAFAEGETDRLDLVPEHLEPIFAHFRAGGAAMSTPLGFAAHMAAPVARVGDRELAALLYERLAPYAGKGTFFAYFAGPFDYHLGLLARTLGQSEAASRHFLAAAEMSVNLGAPRWAARARAAAAS